MVQEIPSSMARQILGFDIDTLQIQHTIDSDEAMGFMQGLKYERLIKLTDDSTDTLFVFENNVMVYVKPRKDLGLNTFAIYSNKQIDLRDGQLKLVD